MENFSYILLAAGKGTRVGGSLPKQYLPIGEKPIIVYSLECANALEMIKEIICVCDLNYRDTITKYCKEYNVNKPIKFVAGGISRQQDVYSGVKNAKYDKVILHEAARPFVSVDDLKRVISYPAENVTLTYEVLNSVMLKNESDLISGVLERDELVNIQLPQKFNKQDLIYSHEQAIKERKLFSEDAGLVFYYTHKPVACLKGNSRNIKITEPIDLYIGELIYQREFLNKR